MTTSILVCDTCRYDANAKLRGEKTGGELFAEQVEQLVASHTELGVRRHACLMGCQRHCTAAVMAPGKMSYVLGDFTPCLDDAATLIDYALKHHLSDTGIVPFKQWPQGVRGHFIARLPSLG